MNAGLTELADRFLEGALGAIKARNYRRASELLVEVIKIKPQLTEAWVMRGNVLHAEGRFFDSLLHYDRALSINDKLHDAWNNRGLAFADLGMWDSAEQCFRRSAELMPAVEPHIGLANMFCTLMRLKEAAAEYQACIDIDPGFLDARFNLGVTLLGQGQWGEGFKEYEYRWQNTAYPPRPYRDYRKWRGEDLNGCRILLYPEQGYGDEIMALRYARYLRMVYADARIVVQARGPMFRLAQSMQGPGLIVAPYNSDEAWAADYSCPLLDVPMALGQHWRDVPRPHQYLEAPDRDKVAYWEARLKTLPQGRNVGLCWNSGGHLNTARAAQLSKSIPLAGLKGLALPGVNLVSLQKPREMIPDGLPLTDWMDECHDFADTAALIEALDLVISVDTAVAHLAGALGKPVWNFVRFSGYWPWLSPDAAPGPSYSIWYPSMTLIRQTRLCDWSGPIEAATGKLRQNLQVAA